MATAKVHPVSGCLERYDGKRLSSWRAKVRLADGTRKRLVLGLVWTEKGRPPEGYLTRKGAEAALQAVLTDARRGIVPGRDRQSGDGLSFGEIVGEWLAWGSGEHGWRPATAADYAATARKWLVPAFGSLPVEEITPRQIEAWRSKALAEEGLGRRSAVKLGQILHAVFGYAVRVHDLPANPMDKVPRLRESYDAAAYDFYSVEEIAALCRSAADEQDAVLFQVAAQTGLRMGELLALRWRDVDLDGQVLRVTRSRDVFGNTNAPKSGKGRSVPLIEPAAQALARLSTREDWTGDDDPVFVSSVGTALDRSKLRKRYRAAARKAGLRPLTFHSLRHAFCSTAIEVGDLVSVQSWAGHSSPVVTSRYLHHKPRREEATMLGRAFMRGTGEARPQAIFLDADGAECSAVDAVKVRVRQLDGDGRVLAEMSAAIGEEAVGSVIACP